MAPTLSLANAVTTTTPGDGGYPFSNTYLYITADEATLMYQNMYGRYDPVAIGEIATWEAYFHNPGPGRATNVTVVDALPVGTTFVSMEAAGSLQGPPTCWVNAPTNTATCVFPSLLAGNYGYVYVHAHVDRSHSPGDTLVNTVTVSANQAAPITIGPVTTTLKADEVDLAVSTSLDTGSLPVVVGDSPVILDQVYVADTSTRPTWCSRRRCRPA